MTLRIARLLTICAAYVAWSPSFACSCVDFTLESRYESSPNVFTAVVTSGEIDEKGNVVAGFEVTEIFKGDVPFEKLKTWGANTSCEASFTVGSKYLFFLGDYGAFDICTGSFILRPDKKEPWLQILKAYKAGETPNLSSPWHNYEYDGACSLNTDFLATGTRELSSLSIFYRYAEPVKESYTEPEFTRPGLAFVAVELPADDEPEGSSIEIETQNREFIASWFHRANGPHILPYGFQLIADEVVTFAEELLNSSSAVLKGSLSRFGPIDGTEIRTTNAGTSISDFISCVNNGTRSEK